MSELLETAICFCQNQIFQENGTQSYCTRYFLNPCDSSVERMSGNIKICSHLLFYFSKSKIIKPSFHI